MKKIKFNLWFLLLAAATTLFVMIVPERLSIHQDKKVLNHIFVEPAKESEGYRYSLSNNEKLYILAKCLENQVLPESELSARIKQGVENMGYEKMPGVYAFVLNYRDTLEPEITEGEIYEICNRELSTLKSLGILPDEVKEVEEGAYSAVLYSAIDVLEPRNNLTVWKVSLSTGQQNADKTNRLLDAYIDADTGRIYTFYARTQKEWSDIVPDEMVEKWSQYMELSDPEPYQDRNPLLETTPYYEKYRFAGMEQESTVVTIGFYEGIQELFLKITK